MEDQLMLAQARRDETIDTLLDDVGEAGLGLEQALRDRAHLRAGLCQPRPHEGSLVASEEERESSYEVTYERVVAIPDAARMQVPQDVLALAALIENLVGDSGVSWSLSMRDQSSNGKGCQSLRAALDRLDDEPELLVIHGHRWVDHSWIGSISVSLPYRGQVTVSGTDRDWVAAAEDRFEEFVKRWVRPVPDAPHRRLSPSDLALAVSTALSAGLALLLATALLPVSLVVPAAVVAAAAMAATVALSVGSLLRQMATTSSRHGVQFRFGDDEPPKRARAPWYESWMAKSVAWLIPAIALAVTLAFGLLSLSRGAH